MRKSALILTFLLACNLTYSQLKMPQTFGKGILNVISADSSWSMKFGMRFQSLYEGETSINDTSGFGASTSTFLIRRARLKFDGHAYSPKLKYKVELGLSNRDIGKVSSTNNSAPNVILDAVLMWNFYGNFELWAGQTKLPGNRERVISSANMQFVDRSMLNSVFNIDRDMGIQLRHHTKLGKQFVIKEALAISQGEGRNVVQDNLGGLEYTGRIELLPFGNFASKGDYVGSDIKREAKPKLALGFTYDYNDRAVKDRSNQGSYMVNGESNDGFFHADIATVFGDMMFKYKGFSVMGEYAMRSAENEDLYSSDSTFHSTVYSGSGLNLCVGYLFKKNWELATRYTSITPADVTGRKATQQYTFCVSRYIVGHALKVQADVSYQTTEDSPNSNLMYRLQFDIHF